MPSRPVHVLDAMRILLGNQPASYLVEVVLRTVVMYLFTLVVIRFLGKRGLSELTPFEYIILIAMGSAVGDPMFYPNVPVLQPMVVLAVIVVMQKVLLRATARSPT